MVSIWLRTKPMFTISSLKLRRWKLPWLLWLNCSFDLRHRRWFFQRRLQIPKSQRRQEPAGKSGADSARILAKFGCSGPHRGYWIWSGWGWSCSGGTCWGGRSLRWSCSSRSRCRQGDPISLFRKKMSSNVLFMDLNNTIRLLGQYYYYVYKFNKQSSLVVM